MENSNGRKLVQGGQCYISEECFGAITESSFDELNKVSSRKDITRLQEMILDGSIYILNKSDQCTVLELKFGKCKLRVDRVPSSINVWVSSEFVESYASTLNNEIKTKEDKTSQPESTKETFNFKEDESIIGTKWESENNDIGETFVLNFISESEVTISSKSLGTRPQTYTYKFPDITFIPEGASKSFGHIYNNRLTVDNAYTYFCVEKSIHWWIKN